MKKLVLILTSFFLFITLSLNAQTNSVGGVASEKVDVEKTIPPDHKAQIGCKWIRRSSGELFCKKIGPCYSCTPEMVDTINWCKCNGGGGVFRSMVEQDMIMGYEKLSVELFPNPTPSEIIVRLQSPVSGKLNIELFDMSGNLVKESTSMMLKGYLSKKLNLSANLSPGMYLVKVTVGEQSVTEQIIISR